MNIEKTSHSTGQKQFKNFLNVMRLFYGNLEKSVSSHYLSNYIEDVTVLETSIDDISGEILGEFIQNMQNQEVLDVEIVSTTTKKNRPGYIIKVICNPEQKFIISEKIITELGTLGVRMNTIERVCVERKIQSIRIEIGGREYDLNYKLSYIESEEGKKIINTKPEYEDLRKISQQSGISLKKVQVIAQSQIQEKLKD